MNNQHPDTSARKSGCVFCSIVDKKTPTEIIFDGGDTLFFRDIHPKAPIHILGIPKKHLTSLSDIVGDDHSLIGKLIHDAAHVAQDAGLTDGYRVIANVGEHAGQEVQHLHFHILGGEPLGPLRC